MCLFLPHPVGMLCNIWPPSRGSSIDHIGIRLKTPGVSKHSGWYSKHASHLEPSLNTAMLGAFWWWLPRVWQLPPQQRGSALSHCKPRLQTLSITGSVKHGAFQIPQTSFGCMAQGSWWHVRLFWEVFRCAAGLLFVCRWLQSKPCVSTNRVTSVPLGFSHEEGFDQSHARQRLNGKDNVGIYQIPCSRW